MYSTKSTSTYIQTYIGRFMKYTGTLLRSSKCSVLSFLKDDSALVEQRVDTVTEGSKWYGFFEASANYDIWQEKNLTTDQLPDYLTKIAFPCIS